ncbi:acetyltransferase [Yersinia similis]|nr:acetyltransferase [Yersinia similis]
MARLLTNPDDSLLNGEDRQKSKESAPRMARLEPTWMYLRRLYDLPVLSVAGTLSITSGHTEVWPITIIYTVVSGAMKTH